VSTIFSKILSGEIPAFKILEDDQFLSFLDVRPVKRGHALVIPKKEIDYIFDLEDDLLSEMMVFSKKVARILKQKIECKKVGVMVAGLEVPHAHVHLIPFDEISDLTFANAKSCSQEELKKIHEEIVG